MTPIKSTLRAALADPELLGNELQGDTFGAWRALLLAAMGEPLIGDELVAFEHLTRRPQPPAERVEQLLVIAGRRAGKSLSAASLAVYQAALVEHVALRGGERGLVLCISPDLRQSRVVRDYCEAILEGSPILRGMVTSKTADSISLSNGSSIECRSASFRRLRGVTCIAVVADESCFWYADGSTNPDSEILAAVQPTLATTGGLLTIISTPYSRRGETWRIFNDHYGPDGDPRILVAQAASRDLNPSLPQSVVDRALERDPAAAAAEYLGQWRSDIASFVDRAAVLACIEQDCRERPFERKHRYAAFTDPSGGSNDSFTLAIAHQEGDQIIIDAIRETRPPFSPASVVREFASVLDAYRIKAVTGDRYAGEFPRELFRKAGITYRLADKTKSDLFLDLLPRLNSGSIRLPDNDRLTAQLINLERRTGFTGADRIGHPPQGHDDVANAVAGAAYEAAKQGRATYTTNALVPGHHRTSLEHCWEQGYGKMQESEPRTKINVVRVPEESVKW